jgi:hypothetical protein
MVFVFWFTRIKFKIFYWFFLIAIPLLAFVGNRNHLLPQPVMKDMVTYYENPESNPYRYSIGIVGNDVLPVNMKGSCYFTDKFITSGSNKEDVPYKIVERKSTEGSVLFSIKDKIIPNDEKIVFNLSYFPRVFNINVNGQEMGYQECVFPVTNLNKERTLLFGKLCRLRLKIFSIM